MPAPKVDLSEVTLDETVLKYLETRGKNTAIAYEKCLKRFVKFYGHPFNDYIREIEERQQVNQEKPITERTRPGEDTLRGFIRWHKEVGYSNYSTLQSLGAVQNILKYYGIRITYDFIETPPPRSMKENTKHEWKLDQIKRFVEAAEYTRDKAFIMVAFQSGLSIGDILDLDYGDIKREFEARKLPLAIERYREKTNVPIRTFIGYDAAYYLRLYLESRPNIKPGDPLFTKLGSEERATPATIQNKLRDYASKLDFIYEEDMNGYNPARPHSLRSGFRSRLTGKMDGDLIESFMAHDIGQEKATYMNQPLDELREIYANYEHLLSINKTSRQAEEEKRPQPLPPEAMAQISKLEASTLNIVEENTDLKQKVNELKVQDLELRAVTQDLEAKLQGEIDILRDIATQMVKKYRVLKDIAPQIWEEVERKTVPDKVLKEAWEDREKRMREEGVSLDIRARPRNSKDLKQ
jgi:integrase